MKDIRIINRILLVGLLFVPGGGCVGEIFESVIGDPILDNRQARYDEWLGKTKEDRVRAVGTPSQCLSLKNGGEACEWRSSQHGGIFTYDKSGVACGWSYSGTLGQRSNDQCDEDKVSPLSEENKSAN